MEKYFKVIEELKQKNIVSKHEIFDYSFSPLQPIYNNYFEYCQEYLDNHCNKYSIQPARIYFCNHFEVNAKAFRRENFSVIGINMGTIQSTYNLFYDKNDMYENEPVFLELYGELRKFINIPMGYFMFQLSTLFTFHHELAHLVQLSPESEKEFVEKYQYEEYKIFDFENHVLEYDSDIHGANAVYSQVLGHFNRLEVQCSGG